MYSCHVTLHLLVLHSPSSFFFNDTATTEIYTLSLHDALPILAVQHQPFCLGRDARLDHLPNGFRVPDGRKKRLVNRSEEHTSELQSHVNLVCRLLLEKKKKKNKKIKSIQKTNNNMNNHAIAKA